MSKSASTLIVHQFSSDRLSAARRWLRDVVGRRDAASELVLTELLANAIEHGAGGPVQVDVVECAVEQVEICVSNNIEGKAQLPTPQIVPPSIRSKRGRGLFLVRSLAALDIEQDGRRIKIRASIRFGQL